MDEGEHRKAERIVTEAKRLEALIADLLEFARGGKLELTPTDPGALLKSALEEVGTDAFRLRTAEIPPWPLDADHMRRALTNLLRNAAQASPAGKKSEVGLTVRNNELAFTVRDFGPGIPAGDESRIFEPFYTTRTTGTGLGLAVARRIAELHDGRITASNHPAGGAVFEILIPRP
jgi:two-component system sensor histidine kinase HydH